jgi:hypothetical protein
MSKAPDVRNVRGDAPIRLASTARLAFPDGSMTVSGPSRCSIASMATPPALEKAARSIGCRHEKRKRWPCRGPRAERPKPACRNRLARSAFAFRCVPATPDTLRPDGPASLARRAAARVHKPVFPRWASAWQLHSLRERRLVGLPGLEPGTRPL